MIQEKQYSEYLLPFAFGMIPFLVLAFGKLLGIFIPYKGTSENIFQMSEVERKKIDLALLGALVVGTATLWFPIKQFLDWAKEFYILRKNYDVYISEHESIRMLIATALGLGISSYLIDFCFRKFLRVTYFSYSEATSNLFKLDNFKATKLLIGIISSVALGYFIYLLPTSMAITGDKIVYIDHLLSSPVPHSLSQVQSITFSTQARNTKGELYPLDAYTLKFNDGTRWSTTEGLFLSTDGLYRDFFELLAKRTNLEIVTVDEIETD